MPKLGRSRLSSRWWALLLSHTHSPVLPLKRKGVCSKHQLFSQLTDRRGNTLTSSSPSPPPHPSLLEVRLHLANPHFFLTIPLCGWLVFSASSSTKETKEAGPLSLFPPLAERRSRGKRTCRPPLPKPLRPSRAKSVCKRNSYTNVCEKTCKLQTNKHPCGACTGMCRCRQ